MGETPDQTRTELDELRADMTRKAADIRAAAEHSAHAAVPAALGLAAVGAAVGGVVLLLRQRRRARQRSFRGRMAKLTEAVQHPAPALDALTHSAQEKLRSELREFAAKPQRPGLGARLLEVAVKAAVTTGTTFALKAAVAQLAQTRGASASGPQEGS